MLERRRLDTLFTAHPEGTGGKTSVHDSGQLIESKERLMGGRMRVVCAGRAALARNKRRGLLSLAYVQIMRKPS